MSCLQLFSHKKNSTDKVLHNTWETVSKHHLILFVDCDNLVNPEVKKGITIIQVLYTFSTTRNEFIGYGVKAFLIWLGLLTFQNDTACITFVRPKHHGVGIQIIIFDNTILNPDIHLRYCRTIDHSRIFILRIVSRLGCYWKTDNKLFKICSVNYPK